MEEYLTLICFTSSFSTELLLKIIIIIKYKYVILCEPVVLAD